MMERLRRRLLLSPSEMQELSIWVAVIFLCLLSVALLMVAYPENKYDIALIVLCGVVIGFVGGGRR